jgi:uncharacterized protein with PhoU and TrkA domain
MGEEVRLLEVKMDKLLYQIRLTAMVAARTVKDAEQLSGILQVASAAENISNAAGDIVRLLDSKIEFRPFIPFVLKRADEKIKHLRIYEDSPMVGKSIGELGVETETGARIIAIKRGMKWIYEVDEHTKLRANDILIARGVEDGLLELDQYSKGIVEWGMYKRSQGCKK